MSKFTPNDILRFIYRETTSDEDMDIKQWIADDELASETFLEMVEARQSIDIEELAPSETSVNIILEYSREHSQVKSHA